MGSSKDNLILLACELDELKAKVAEFEQYKRESIKWSVDDFMERAKQIGYKLTIFQAQHALEDMIDRHDAEYGINWCTLDFYIQTYGKEKKRK